MCSLQITQTEDKYTKNSNPWEIFWLWYLFNLSTLHFSPLGEYKQKNISLNKPKTAPRLKGLFW